MLRFAVAICCLLVAGLVWPEGVYAQSDQIGINIDNYLSARYGEFFSWYKLMIVVLVWLVWIFIMDRINRDLLRWSDDLEMSTETWNTVNVGVMILGVGCVLFVPIFWVGMPLFVLAAFLPAIIFRAVRRSRLKSSAGLLYKIKGKSDLKNEDFEEAEIGKLQFRPEGDETTRTRLQIEARQSPVIELTKNLLGNGLAGRVDLLRLEYTRQGVAGRMQIDGVWNPMPPLDREQGDQMLVTIKNLAGMNPAERRKQQQGRFGIKWDDAKLEATVEVTSQGVAAGEIVQIKYQRGAAKAKTLVEIGLAQESAERAKRLLNAPGLIVISAPQHGGLTTLWQSCLMTSDRMTRDVVAFVKETEIETRLENILQRPIKTGEDPLENMRKSMLTQPNVLVIPDLLSPKVADAATNEVVNQERSCITRTNADSCAEALLSVYKQVGDRKQFAQALSGIINQRLVRRLCRKCKVEVPVKPELILKLGGNPKTQKTLFRHYQLPPIEQRIDEKGNPVEMKPCSTCGGTGFIDRTAALEIVEVDDAIRQVLLKSPTVEDLDKAFRAAGSRTALEEASRLVLSGETSLEEVRRVFRPSK